MGICGWMGRAEQTAGTSGCSVARKRTQPAPFGTVARESDIAIRDAEIDVMTIRIETRADNHALHVGTVLVTLKLRGTVVSVPPGSISNAKRIRGRHRFD